MASRNLVPMLMALWGLAISCGMSEASCKRPFIPPPRFPFKIDPITPLEDLLPRAPEAIPYRPSVLNEDLTRVHELMFAKPLARKLGFLKAQEETANRRAKINNLNQKSEDGFMKEFLAKRADLHGLPFLMGKESRTEAEQAELFAAIVATIQIPLQDVEMVQKARGKNGKGLTDDQNAASFWAGVLELQKSTPRFGFGPGLGPGPGPDPGPIAKDGTPAPDETERAIVAALTQIIAPMPEPFRIGLAKHLLIKHPDATRALAKLALCA